MLIPQVRYLDADGNEVDTAEEAVMTEIGGTLRTRKGNKPQIKKNNAWVDIE